MASPFPDSKSRIALFPRQKYYLTSDSGSLEEWNQALRILEELDEFHELLTRNGFTVMLSPSMKLGFKDTAGTPFGPRYSRLEKVMWGTPAIRCVLDDYGIYLVNKQTNECVL